MVSHSIQTSLHRLLKRQLEANNIKFQSVARAAVVQGSRLLPPMVTPRNMHSCFFSKLVSVLTGLKLAILKI